ncbi:single-stranded-DNA-specific exonuclease RecJ [Desulfopila inferna]|uniref:single-stranded-DNA-specific exonuclease RecJ n=1 Tax=Desulfopila inferna TaxID=468528 RepID=UPI00196416B4|nr:single-stranded-DNA-specific exonuclease RecJ [Desulfopila inferna]MBM9602840.1 single-stranded-DNA-specific exonuclease RecJ [Desulfopila inferna]
MKSLTERYWRLPLPYIASADEKTLAGKFGVEPEIIKILNNRGLSEKKEIEKFLYPTLYDLENPSELLGMAEACALVYQALIEEQEIIIWGDYDVDGVTATCVLVSFFQSLQIKVRWFIPNRFTDGYGLELQSLKVLLEECSSSNPLLITVDCGISNDEEVAFARSRGCRVIVTDHHEPGEGNCSADAVINPKQRGCQFKDKNIAGVGLAFYLAMGIRAFLEKKMFFNRVVIKPNLKQLLELVAIGTIADMVSLTNCNRILVKAGFEVLNISPSPGVAALLEECDIRSANITAEDIAFQVAPKINAAGRLEEAGFAAHLLLENDPAIAKKLARKLSNLNKKRKELCEECLETTLTNIEYSLNSNDHCCIAKVDYSIGILGIVASQIGEKTGVPVILVTSANDKKLGRVLKGSCRSIPGINIHQALKNCKDFLIKYGGHPMAAGVTLHEEMFDDFRNAFSAQLSELSSMPAEPREVDLEMEMEKVLSAKIIQQMQMLEPFGVDNEKPIFIDRNIILQDINKLGRNGDHLSFRKRGRFKSLKCVAFRFGEYENIIKNSPEFNMIYTISISRYKKAAKWQAQLVDFL